MESIFKRTSIRRFLEKEVEPEKIEKILRAAMAAPSGGNQQPWEFFVVRDKDVIKKLSKSSIYSGCAENAPLVIVPCLKTNGTRYPELVTMDLSNATENMLLEITELGLGGVWLSIAPYEDRMAIADKILGIGKDLHAFALIPVGYPLNNTVQQDRYDESRIHYT